MNFFEIHFAAGTYMRYFRMLCTAAVELQRERTCVGMYILHTYKLIFRVLRSSIYIKIMQRASTAKNVT